MKQVRNRQKQVAQQIQTLVAQAISQELKDPELGMVTITNVDVSVDLGYANIYFVVLEQERSEQSLAVLTKAASFLRKRLAKQLTLRVVPRLRFKLDNSEKHARQMDELISQLPEDLEDSSSSYNE